MRIAIHHPFYLAQDQTTNFNGYDYEFVRLFKPIIYTTGWRRALTRGAKFKQGIRQGGLNPYDFDYAFSERELNRKADVLVCFNGWPYLPLNAPPKKFKGMKVFHVMDHHYRASESNRILQEAGVNYVMGYADHSKYCSFFQKFYPGYAGKVIPVPFGFGKRFENKTPFADRCKKVIALGSVNPVDDPAAPGDETLKDYKEFYKGTQWTHQWRRTLVENEESLRDIMDSQLPRYPETKNPKYDAVDMMNRYALFANDEGLMAFPPARTYEGTAAGCVLVCSDHPCYDDIGFVDGVNCIRHRKLDVEDFKEKTDYYLARPERLEAIQKAGTEMARREYTHENIARNVKAEIEKRWQGRS